jgi:hypothetical protein
MLVMLFALLCLAAAPAGAIETHGSLGPGGGITLPSHDRNPCNGTLIIHYDGVDDCDGYCWQYGGIAPPYYGAFAECYDFDGTVCGIELQLSSLGYPCFGCDLYVWEDAGGIPGNVLSFTGNVDPCPVAIWPNVSTHDLPIDNVPVAGTFWVGYWTDASDSVCPYLITASCHGVGSCPFTNIAPGMGYPTGWHDVSLVWGSTQSIGIGVWRLDEGTPINQTSWGRVKAGFK